MREMSRTRTLLRFVAAAAVLAAGTAVVGRAANLSTSSHTLGTVTATVPTCAPGSVTVGTTGSPITAVTVTLTSCTEAIVGNVVYVTLHDTTIATGNYLGYGTCTLLAGVHPNCTANLTGKVRNNGTDTYSLQVVAQPAVTGATSSSADGLKLASEYLTLRTCTAKGPPTTC